MGALERCEGKTENFRRPRGGVDAGQEKGFGFSWSESQQGQGVRNRGRFLGKWEGFVEVQGSFPEKRRLFGGLVKKFGVSGIKD